MMKEQGNASRLGGKGCLLLRYWKNIVTGEDNSGIHATVLYFLVSSTCPLLGIRMWHYSLVVVNENIYNVHWPAPTYLHRVESHVANQEKGLPRF